MSRVRSALQFLVTAGVATWLGGGFVQWAGQEWLIFPAPRGIARADQDRVAAELGATVLELRSEDGTPLYGWHLRAPAGRGRLVLLFHGNGDALVNYPPVLTMLADAGWDTLVVAYRGYPGSGGSPGQAGIEMDARAAWAWATGPGGYEPGRIVVHGLSLGGGVAAGLVAGPADPAALVLEQTFTSMTDMARHRAPVWPVEQLLRHPFDTRGLVGRLGVPVLLMHSADDRLIPPDLGGRALATLVPRAEYHEVAGYPHGPCLPFVDPGLRQVYLAFLDRHVP